MGLGVLRVETALRGVFEKALPVDHKVIGHREVDTLSCTDLVIEGDDMPPWEPGDTVAYVEMDILLSASPYPLASAGWRHKPDQRWQVGSPGQEVGLAEAGD